MTVQRFTYQKLLRLGTGFNHGRVSISITLLRGQGGAYSTEHAGVEGDSFMWHTVANVSDNKSIPKNSSWLGNCIENLAGEVELPLSAELTQSKSDCFWFSR